MATDQILSDRYKDQQDWCWQQQQPKQQLKNTAPNQEQDDDQDHHHLHGDHMGQGEPHGRRPDAAVSVGGQVDVHSRHHPKKTL